jgi:hypothetical protein
MKGCAPVAGRKALAKQWRDFVRLRIAAEHRFREHELAVQVNVEDASPKPTPAYATP